MSDKGPVELDRAQKQEYLQQFCSALKARDPDYNGDANAGGRVIAWIFGMFVFNLIFGGFTTQYLANYWYAYFSGLTLDISFMPCFWFGLLFGGFTAPLALITYLLSFFI